MLTVTVLGLKFGKSFLFESIVGTIIFLGPWISAILFWVSGLRESKKNMSYRQSLKSSKIIRIKVREYPNRL